MKKDMSYKEEEAKKSSEPETRIPQLLALFPDLKEPHIRQIIPGYPGDLKNLKLLTDESLDPRPNMDSLYLTTLEGEFVATIRHQNNLEKAYDRGFSLFLGWLVKSNRGNRLLGVDYHSREGKRGILEQVWIMPLPQEIYYNDYGVVTSPLRMVNKHEQLDYPGSCTNRANCLTRLIIDVDSKEEIKLRLGRDRKPLPPSLQESLTVQLNDNQFTLNGSGSHFVGPFSFTLPFKLNYQGEYY